MIPKSNCKDRQLYRIHSRNLKFGVFRESTGGFLGLRTKFGSAYIFEEYHWENEAFATVQPQEELPEVLPSEIELADGLGSFCLHCDKKCKYIDFPNGSQEVFVKGKSLMVEGKWEHIEETDCQDVKSYYKSNKPLYNWLIEMEKKYNEP